MQNNDIKLVKIEGNLWELSVLQNKDITLTDLQYYKDIQEQYKLIIHNEDPRNNERIRVLKGNHTISRAYAIIEILVHGLPQQGQYTIYYCNKGFYCKVQKRIVYLSDLVEIC